MWPGKIIGKNVTPTVDIAPNGIWNLIDQYTYNRSGVWPDASDIVDTGLIFYLNATNNASYPGSGTTWTDLSGSNRNATLYNGVAYSSEYNGLLTFDGINDYATTAAAMFNPTTAFTFGCWIRRSNDNGTIISAISPISSFQIRFATGVLEIVSSFTSIVGSFSNFTSALSTWYNITITRSSNTYSLYVNGVFISSFTSTTSFNSPTSIGVNYNNTERFAGSIPILYAYQRVLTASEIERNFEAFRRIYGL